MVARAESRKPVWGKGLDGAWCMALEECWVKEPVPARGNTRWLPPTEGHSVSPLMLPSHISCHFFQHFLISLNPWEVCHFWGLLWGGGPPVSPELDSDCNVQPACSSCGRKIKSHLNFGWHTDPFPCIQETVQGGSGVEKEVFVFPCLGHWRPLC